MSSSRRRFGKVRQLPSGRWQASYVAPDGRRRCGPDTFTSKTEAGDWLVDIESDLLAGAWRDPDAGQELLTDYLERWIGERDLKPRTVDLYRWLAKKRIVPALGHLPLVAVTPAKVRTWRTGLLADGVSADSTAKAYRLLRTVLNTAADDNVIARNPCRIKGAGVHTTPERPTLDLGQAMQLQALFPARLAAMVTLAVFGSLRYGEIIGLRRRDLDLATGTVYVHEQINERSSGEMIIGSPKSAAGVRRIALPATAMDTLAAHLDHFVEESADALLFTNAVGGPIRRSGFNAASGWKAAVAELGVPLLHFNDLRHTGNTIAASTPGISLRDLMERMGHASMRAALIYQHANREADRRIADAFDSQVRGLSVVPPACPYEQSDVVTGGDSSGGSVRTRGGTKTATKRRK